MRSTKPPAGSSALAAVARAQGQHRLRALQRLDLALLVPAQHHRFVARVQAQSHHIVKLFYKFSVPTELEALHQMRFQTVSVPNALRRGFAQALSLCHASAVPVCRIRRCAVQCGFHHSGNFAGRNLGNTSEPQRILFQSQHAQHQKALPPELNGRAPELQLNCNCLIHKPVGGQADRSRPLDQSQRQGSRCRPLLQRAPLLRRAYNRCRFLHESHLYDVRHRVESYL